MRRPIFIILLLAPLVLAACTWKETKQTFVDAKNAVLGTEPTTSSIYPEDDTPIIELNYDAADELHHDIDAVEMPPGSKLYVKRFTNSTDADDRAPFGGIVADQVAARLAQRDHLITEGPPELAPVAEPKPMLEANATEENDSIFLPQAGKGDTTPMPAVLTGQYTIGENVIYVTAKIMRLDDGAVIAGHSWTLPQNRNTRELLPQLKAGTGGTTPAVQTSF